MLVSMVSEDNGAGKTHAAQTLVRSDLDFYKHSFTWDLSRIGDMFLGFEELGKYDVHPYLGVSKKDIINAVSKTLEGMHPELPVMRTKQAILQFIDDGHNVVIDDVRRERDFKWLDMLASGRGIKHHIIEIVPTKRLDGLGLVTKPDIWSNGMEPCGSEVWQNYKDRSVILNSNDETFEQAIIRTVEALAGGSVGRMIGPL